MTGKRLFDIAAALVALALLWPLMALAALAVWSGMGSPILFRQLRPGWKGLPFPMLKFRTMRNACAPDGRPLPDGQRLTGLGRFLRRTSLDELPQLWNVLKGDMSMVGPRPLLLEYIPRYNDFQRRRHEARPGITGWSQVMGRNALSWERKFEFDVWYVDHGSFLLDLRILCLTAVQVLRRDGINRDGFATTPYFQGNRVLDP